MISFYNTVSETGFANDWHARLRERSDISIDGADTRLEFICNILGPGHSASLQMNEDGDQSIDAVHDSYLISLC